MHSFLWRLYVQVKLFTDSIQWCRGFLLLFFDLFVFGVGEFFDVLGFLCLFVFFLFFVFCFFSGGGGGVGVGCYYIHMYMLPSYLWISNFLSHLSQLKVQVSFFITSQEPEFQFYVVQTVISEQSMGSQKGFQF